MARRTAVLLVKLPENQENNQYTSSGPLGGGETTSDLLVAEGQEEVEGYC